MPKARRATVSKPPRSGPDPDRSHRPAIKRHACRGKRRESAPATAAATSFRCRHESITPVRLCSLMISIIVATVIARSVCDEAIQPCFAFLDCFAFARNDAESPLHLPDRSDQEYICFAQLGVKSMLDRAQINAGAKTLHDHWQAGTKVRDLTPSQRPRDRACGYSIQKGVQACGCQFGWKIVATREG